MNVIKTKADGTPQEVELEPNEQWIADRHQKWMAAGFGVVWAAEEALLDFWYAFPGSEDSEDSPFSWQFFRWLVGYTKHERSRDELAKSPFHDDGPYPTSMEEWDWNFYDENPIEGNFALLEALRWHAEMQNPRAVMPEDQEN